MEEQTTLIDPSDRRNSAWDIKNAPRNYISLVLTQGGSAFFAFAAVWLLTRTIGPQGYGGVVAVISASMLVQVLVNWTTITVVKFGVDEFVETGKIARIFWSRLFLAIVNIILVIAAYPLWFPVLSGWLMLSDEVMWLLILHFFVAVVWLHMQYSLQAVKLPRIHGLLQMVERVFIFTSLIILLLTGQLGLITAILSYTVAPIVTTLLSFFVLRKFIFERFTTGWVFWRDIFLYSAPLFPTAIFFYFTGGYGDAIFITKYLSQETLGVYAVASQFSGIILQLPTLANSLLLPMFVSLHRETQPERLNNYFRNILPTLILGWGVLCTAFAFVCYFLIPLVFGAKFSPAVGPLWILLPTSVLALPLLIGYASLSNAISATYIGLFGSALAALANIGFNIALIPVWGIEGCAWATSIMLFSSSAVYVALLRKRLAGSIPWTILAVLPAVSASVCFFLTKNPWISLGGCITLTFFVAYLFKDSIRSSISFIRNLGKI